MFNKNNKTKLQKNMYHLRKVDFFVSPLLFIKVFQTCNKSRQYGMRNPKYAHHPASIHHYLVNSWPTFAYRPSTFLSCHFEGEPRHCIFFVNISLSLTKDHGFWDDDIIITLKTAFPFAFLVLIPGPRTYSVVSASSVQRGDSTPAPPYSVLVRTRALCNPVIGSTLPFQVTFLTSTIQQVFKFPTVPYTVSKHVQ